MFLKVGLAKQNWLKKIRTSMAKRHVSKKILASFLDLIFFMLVLLLEYNFLTTSYGLYFNRQLHITLYNFFKFLYLCLVHTPV